MRRQKLWSPPRPTRPRSWWSWESPNRSACSIIITVALGTSTPTSITVVATRRSASPDLNRCIASSFSYGSIRPWTISARYGRNRWRSSSNPDSASFRSSFSLSSTSG
jgi:hypothetical protein